MERESFLSPKSIALRGTLLLTVVAGSLFATAENQTSAQDDKAAQSFAVDMDPAASPANTPTSVGTREVCARINNNMILDADEDDIDGIDLDVTAEDIPEISKMIAFSFKINYPSPGLVITEKNTEGLLSTTPNYSKFDVSPHLPDFDGSYTVSVVDVSTNGAFGSGYLTGFKLKTTENTAQGNFGIVLSEAAHIDQNNEVWEPKKLENGVVAINEDCGASPLITPSSTETPAPGNSTNKPLELPSTGGQVKKLNPRFGLLSALGGVFLISSGIKLIRKSRI